MLIGGRERTNCRSCKEGMGLAPGRSAHTSGLAVAASSARKSSGKRGAAHSGRLKAISRPASRTSFASGTRPRT
eukprot:1193248-Prorocentrum_minimum.AAC.2